MPQADKMICPDCGVEMNLHAEKLDYNLALVEPDGVDADLGGVVEEVHTCPECGGAASRRAE